MFTDALTDALTDARTPDRPVYKLTFEPLAQVSYKFGGGGGVQGRCNREVKFL